MRDLRELDAFRNASLERMICGGALDPRARARVGAFEIPSSIDRKPLRCIVSAVEGWDHVSVSRPTRCPNWPEMCAAKEAFFLPDECVMQLHVPAADHVNNHPFCLHLWGPHEREIPRPPGLLVGIAGQTADETREAAAELFRLRGLGYLDPIGGLFEPSAATRGRS